MVRWLPLTLTCALLVASAGDARGGPAAVAQPAQAPAPAADGITGLLGEVEKLLQARNAAALPPLFSAATAAAPLQAFFDDLLTTETKRVVVRERDRLPLEGVLPGDGFQLVVDFFLEGERRGRIVTARVDVRRPSRSERDDEWRLLAAERLTNVEGLYRLALDSQRQFTARNLTLKAEDMQLVLQEGAVFVVDSADGITGLVLLGRGQMVFSPAPEAERIQVRIFSGSETLTTRFDAAFVRLNPVEYEARLSTNSLTPAPVDARLLKRAQDIFDADAPKSFSLDLDDLSPDTWYLIPSAGDVLAEVRTRGHGALTYARSTNEAEDVTLFDRAKRRNIALYASAQKLSTRGRFYNEDDLAEYDVLDHHIEAVVTPAREFIQARARMRVRIRTHALATLTIRLADPLEVSNVVSVEHGRLLHLRVRNQNAILVNLPTAMRRDSEMTVIVTYSGRLPSQGIDTEALQIIGFGRREDVTLAVPEPNYLLSNRAFWYPQGQVTDFATATLRITVPENYGCVASGEPAAGSPVTLRTPALPDGPGKLYLFTATDPLRYLSLVVSRFVRVSNTTVPLVDGAASEPLPSATTAEGRRAAGFRVRDRLTLHVEANPRQQMRAKETAGWAAEILRFYTGIIGEMPYPAMSLALLENELPGGHSPGYMVALNNPLPSTPFVWRNDPATFNGFPEFFLAHELAHQWWGQAVGWKNYHEQWISEGFAQYFAALYAQKVHGDDTFTDMLRQFRRWALAESDEGPVYLGYRLGHIKGDQKVFRALLYNKGAAVLHMLRRLVGDEVFFNALRRFYNEQKFAKAGTADLQRAFEEETGASFERFFERWIFGSALPRLRYVTQVGAGEVIVRFEQVGDLLFDLPVTVSVALADGRSLEIVVPVTEKLVERRIPVDGPVRAVQVNRDSAAIAHFDES